MKNDFQKTIDFEKEQAKRIAQEKEAFAATITPEEMAAIEAEVNNFAGTKHHLGKEERHKQIGRAAELLYLSDMNVIMWNSEKSNREQRNAMTTIDVNHLLFLGEKSLAAFKVCVSLADDIAITATDKFTRISFGVRDIWE